MHSTANTERQYSNCSLAVHSAMQQRQLCSPPKVDLVWDNSLASLDLIGARSSRDIEASLGQVQLAAVGQSLVASLTRVLQAVNASLHTTHNTITTHITL